MKKIISLFQRNYDTNHLVRDEVVPGADWVLEGLGTPTQKWDGTCCLFRDGKLYKRYEVKKGNKPPINFEPVTEIDPHTEKQQGWVPVCDTNEDKWHREGLENSQYYMYDGTYELVGPKIQGNPERVSKHCLCRHGERVLENVPRNFDGIKEYLLDSQIEGIVWHHPDGKMVKIKKRDFKRR